VTRRAKRLPDTPSPVGPEPVAETDPATIGGMDLQSFDSDFEAMAARRDAGSAENAGPADPPVESAMQTMDEAECRDHLGSGGIGRCLFWEGRGPVALPVNFRLVRGDILFSAGAHTVLSVLATESRVTFEVDHLDETVGEGWSVVVSGQAHLLTTPGEIDAVRSLGVAPYMDGGLETFVRIVPTEITGRRVRIGSVIGLPGAVDHPPSVAGADPSALIRGALLAEIDGLLEGRIDDEHDVVDQTGFSVEFTRVCEHRVRPTMEAVIGRLRLHGGGGFIEEHAHDVHHQARGLTLWMSLDGEITGTPRRDRHPYLELDADADRQMVTVSEGDMWQGRGGKRTGKAAEWLLSDITSTRVTEELVAILRRAVR
jgi:hypothetical protein